MTHRPSVLRLFISVTLLGACARYEWVNELDSPGGCPTARRRPFARRGTFRVDSGRSPLPPGEVAGTVVRVPDAVPVAAALVTVRPDSGGAGTPRGVQSDSLGRFRIEGLSAGRYELATRRIGYGLRYDTVRIGAAGLRVEVGIEPQAMDGLCSGLAMVRVRKPWWKVW